MDTGLQVVLGASGGAGRSIAKELIASGRTVRVVNRSGGLESLGAAENLVADVTSPAGAAAAVRNASIVYMAAQPAYWRWAEEFPGMLDSVIAATAAAGARLVMVDNLYMYGPGITRINEDSPENGGSKKGRVRSSMSATLAEAHRSGRLQVTIGRASDYFGPHAENSGITALAIEPAVEGKSIKWMGSTSVPHSVAYLPDVAKAYMTIAESERAYGETWVLPHSPATTGAEFLAAVNRVLPSPLKTGVISTRMLRIAAPFHKISKETLDIAYQWTEPFVADDTKFRRAFAGFDTTPLDEAVATTVEWFRHQRGV